MAVGVGASEAVSPIRSPGRTSNAKRRNNAMAPSEIPSPSSIYTIDSQAGSDFSIQDYFPTPEAVRPSLSERNPSGMIIADEETASPTSIVDDEAQDGSFDVSKIRNSISTGGPPRPPDTFTGSGTRMGHGKRYDEAPTPGISGLRERASSLDSQASSITDGRKRNIRRAGTPRFDTYSGAAGDLFGNYQIGKPTETDYFSFKGPATPGSGTDRHAYEEISPTSVPILVPEAAHTRDAAPSWNNGNTEPKNNTVNNAAAPVVRDSLNASSATLVTPADENKQSAAEKRSFGSLSLFRRKKDVVVEDDIPGHSRQAYREKVKSMRNGEKLRPSYKRLTTGQ